MSDNPLDQRPWRRPPVDYRVPSKQLPPWPDGNRIAVVVYVNVEHFRYDAPSTVGLTPPQLNRVPDVINWTWREYGNRVGIWRLIDVFRRYGVKPTAAINSAVIEEYPPIAEALLADGWEFLDHGVTNSTQMYGLSAEDQLRIVRESADVIKQFTGKAPKGWSGPGLAETFDTLDILADEGFEYVAEWGICDDYPFELHAGDRRLVGMPYPQETNDLPTYLWMHRTADEAHKQFVDQFDALYRESEEVTKLFTVSLHPYLSGVPHRIWVIDELLKHITSREGVWLATADEVQQHFRNSGTS